MEAFKKFIQALIALFSSKEGQKLIGQLGEEPKPGERELPGADDRQTVTIGVVIGHTKKDGGAVMAVSKEQEYSYNSKIAQLMVSKSLSDFHNLKVIPFFRDSVGIAGAYAAADKAKCDLVIELHFNAANQKATGTETLCTSSPNDVAFAHQVQAEVCRVFGRQGMSRGVKAIARAARGGVNVHSFPNGANCLVEPFFGDTPSEAVMARERMGVYAEALLRACELYARKVDLIK